MKPFLKKFALLAVSPILISSVALSAETVDVAAGSKPAMKKTGASSQSLIQQAWQAFSEKDYKRAIALTDECIARFDATARQEQSKLVGKVPEKQMNSYWELNDVGTAKFIQAKSYLDQGDNERGRQLMGDIVQHYPSAMAYDRGGWYWNVAEAAVKYLYSEGTEVSAVSDGSSSYLKNHAIDFLDRKDYKNTMISAEKCIQLHRGTAIAQQKQLTKYPDEKRIPQYWALNDVGTCYYVAGTAAAMTGDKAKAKEYFDAVRKDLKFASYWNKAGWYVPLSELVNEKETELGLSGQ